MNLEYITEYIDHKIYQNDQMITLTFYELRLKEKLTKEEAEFFVKLSKQRLINLGYSVYETGEKYQYQEKEEIVNDNLLYVAIKNR